MSESKRMKKELRIYEDLMRRGDIDFRARPRTLAGEQVYEIELRSADRPTPARRLADNDFREYWLQRYIAENFRRLGFADIVRPRPPREPGPDFKVLKGKKWHDAEAEVLWKSYLIHKHHLSSDFKEVRYLILLCADEPPKEAHKHLPPKIVHVDRCHFLEWYAVAGAEYARHAPGEFKIEYARTFDCRRNAKTLGAHLS